MPANRRKFARRTMGYGARVIATDGSWSHNCRVIDVSDGGAKLAFEQALDLPRDFILALSQRGVARRCRLMWMTGQEIGVRFDRPRARAAP